MADARLRTAADAFRQAADPMRLTILSRLAAGPLNVGEICVATGRNQPAISATLTKLRLGRIVECETRGKHRVYTLTERGRTLAGIVDIMGERP